MSVLKIFRTHPNVTLPQFQTKGAACFDLAYQPHGKFHIDGFNRVNVPYKRQIAGDTGILTIAPGERMMIPTGLVMDIPEGYSVRIHPRSGFAYKNGMQLANCEGVVDSDYVEEIFVLLYNASEVNVKLTPGDRIAQAEMVRVESYAIEDTAVRPTQKGNRVGGLGSTGFTTTRTVAVAAGDPVVYNLKGVAPMEGPKPEVFTLNQESKVLSVEVGNLPKEKIQKVLQEATAPAKRGRGRPSKKEKLDKEVQV